MPKLPNTFVFFVGTDLEDGRPLTVAMQEQEEKVREACKKMVEQGHFPACQQMLTAKGIITVVLAGNPIPSDLAIATPRPTVLGGN